METISNPVTERGKPPIPKAAYKIVNPLMKLILRSPFHGVLSHAMMILSFRGRKTGKTISTPVGYTRQGNSIIVFTFADWWKNLQKNPDVTMRLQGKDVKGRAAIVTDLRTIGEMVNAVVDARGEQMAQRMGFERVSPNDSPEQIHAKSSNLFFMRIDLAGDL